MLTVIIQAGGTSSRMGQNKALMPFLGEPLISRIVQRVQPVADEMILVSNEPESFQFLMLPVVADIYPGRGALGGLYTGLKAARDDFAAVIACDMPFASPGLILAELELVRNEGVDVVIPRSAFGLEPQHSLYRRAVCLPPIQQALQDGLQRMISWFPAVKVREMTAAEIAQADPGGRAFINVNTPEDFAGAEALARQGD